MAFVVVIDDEEALADLYAVQLQSMGHQTLEFTDSRKALGWLQDHRPDLVVSDMRMPHVSGADICAYVRERWPGVGVIVASGFMESDVKLPENGVDRLLKKPFGLDELGDTVELVLQTYSIIKKAG